MPTTDNRQPTTDNQRPRFSFRQEAGSPHARRKPPRLVSNAAANYVGQIVTVVVGVLLTPLLVGHLGVAMYGVLVLVSAVQGLGGMLDLGLTSSVVKYVAEHQARGEIDETSKVVSTSLLLHIVLGACALLLTLAGALWGMPLLQLTPEQLPVARVALLIAGATLALRLPLGMLGSLVIGLRRYEWSNGVTVVMTVLTAGVTIVALELGYGPVALVLINGISLLLGLGVRVLLARQWLPGLQVSPRLANRATLRRITGYSIWLFLLDAATRIFYDADAVLIAAFLPVSQVTAYNLGWKPASAVSYLSGPLVGVFFPAASEMHARSAMPELRRLLVTGTRLALGLTLTGVLGLLLFGRQVLEVWIGPGHEDALPVLYVLLVVFLVSAAQNPAGVILRGMGRVRTMALAVMLEYAANIAISVFLITRIGVVGAAIGTLVPALFNDIFFIPALACRELDLPFGSYLRRAWLRPLIAALPVLAIVGPVVPALLPASLLPVVLAGAGVALLYAVAFLALAATPEERDLVRRVLGEQAGALSLRRGRTRNLLDRRKGKVEQENEYGATSGAKPRS